MTQTYQYYDPQTGERRPDPGRKGNNKKSNKLLRTIALAIVFGLIAGLTFTGVNYAGGKLLGNKAQTTSTANTQSGSDDEIQSTKSELQNTLTTSDTGMSISDIAENAMPSVVSITAMSIQEVQSFFGPQTQEAKSAGSGIILGENDNELLIATNNHVVSGSKETTVTFTDDESVEASIKGTDSKLDLAVVAVNKSDIPEETKKKIKVATMGDSSSVRVGDTAIAIGNALGYGQSVTTGVISATNRSIDEVDGKYIQTDAAINPGNSGGALLNAKGEIIGINSAKIQDTSVEGMGYAIPISDVKEILQTLMNKQTRKQVAEGEQGYLGIEGQTISEDTVQQFSQLSLPTGVYVYRVLPGSAAEKAGIEEGCVITYFDDTEIDGMDSLQSLLKTYKAGEKVKVKLAVPDKDNKYTEEKTVEVTLGKAPN